MYAALFVKQTSESESFWNVSLFGKALANKQEKSDNFPDMIRARQKELQANILLCTKINFSS